jgi:cytochrome c peroxidase
MHDGRFATLEEVLDHYNRGGSYSPTVDPLIRVGRGLGLTAQDKADIIAFLHTLTDSAFVNDSTLASPFATR